MELCAIFHKVWFWLIILDKNILVDIAHRSQYFLLFSIVYFFDHTTYSSTFDSRVHRINALLLLMLINRLASLTMLTRLFFAILKCKIVQYNKAIVLSNNILKKLEKTQMMNHLWWQPLPGSCKGTLQIILKLWLKNR